MEQSAPASCGPYRTNAREARDARPRRARPRAPAIRLLAAPRYVGLAVVVVIASTVGLLNAEVRAATKVLTPTAERVEDVMAVVLALTLPLVCCSLVRAWQLVPAPRRLKRKHIAQGTFGQLAAVCLGLIPVLLVRPSSTPILGTNEGPDGSVAYVHASTYGCGYRIGVSDGRYGVRNIGDVGPFPCDAPPPRVEWRGDHVALVARDGTEIGTWSTER